MPDESHNSTHLVLDRLGAGEVVVDLPPQDLLESPVPRVVGPRSPRALNMQMLNNVATRRSGYAAFDTTKKDSDPITGLFHAVFDDDTTGLIRATAGKLYNFTGSAYTDLSGAATFDNNDETDYWSFAMVPRIGAVNPRLWVAALDTNNEIKVWRSGAAAFVDVADSPEGAIAIVSFLSRAWVANYLTDLGARAGVRIGRSVVGDATDWTGDGAGETDLNGDPYPIQQLVVMAGGMVILKGDQFGGSIWRGTPTGLVSEPVRYDAMNPGSGVGILLRRSLVMLSESVAFFVGHDGFYLYDGVRGFKRVADGITLSLLRDLNYNALDAAFAEYKPRTSEILVHVPTGASTTPDLTWVFNRRDNRVYGPYEYGQSLTSSSLFVISGSLIWRNGGADDLSEFDTWGDLPWSSWSEIGGATGASSIVYGDTIGELYNDTDSVADTDAGVTISTAYSTATVVADGRVLLSSRGQPIPLGPHDLLTLQDLAIEYTIAQTFSPTIEVSTDDGNTWTTVSGGEALPAGGGESQWFTWTPQITAQRFMARVTTTAEYELRGMHLRFTHGGDNRNG